AAARGERLLGRRVAARKHRGRPGGRPGRLLPRREHARIARCPQRVPRRRIVGLTRRRRGRRGGAGPRPFRGAAPGTGAPGGPPPPPATEPGPQPRVSARRLPRAPGARDLVLARPPPLHDPLLERGELAEAPDLPVRPAEHPRTVLFRDRRNRRGRRGGATFD